MRPQHHTGKHGCQGPCPPVEVAASPSGSLGGAPLKSSSLPPQPLVMDRRQTLPAYQPHPEERVTQCPHSRQEAEGVLGCFQAGFWPFTVFAGQGGTRGSQLLSPTSRMESLGSQGTVRHAPTPPLAHPQVPTPTWLYLFLLPPNRTGVRVHPQAPGQPGGSARHVCPALMEYPRHVFVLRAV